VFKLSSNKTRSCYLTRAEYFQRQRDIGKSTARAEQETARRIRASTRELVVPLVKQYEELGTIIYPVEELARRIDHIIREEASKPVLQARELQEEMEQSLQKKLDILVGHSEPQENAKQKRIENARKPVGSIIRTPGKAFGIGTGFAGYRRDPITGKIIWDDLPLEHEFRKRADLSTLVWKAVEEQEQRVFDVIQGGRAAGMNVKQIGKSLEDLINHQNGGERVVGRWRNMFPNTEAGRKSAWERDYLKEHGGLLYGTDAAKELLRQPDAQAWIRERMEDKTKRGTPRLPDAVKQYANRLGKAGLDYRAMRIARTETTAMVADEQLKIAENSDIATGEMDFVMERGRDHWNCNCEKYAAQNPWKVDDTDRPEIPVHPNCMCEWRPRLKTDAEIVAAFKEEMAEDLGIIEGTPEQKEMLDAIDHGLCPVCGRAFNASVGNILYNADRVCDGCGKPFDEIGVGESSIDPSGNKLSFTNFNSVKTTEEERSKKEYLAVICEKAGLPAYEYEDFLKIKYKDFEFDGKKWHDNLSEDCQDGIRHYTGIGY